MLGLTEALICAVTFLVTYFAYKRIGGNKNGRRYPPSLPALPLVGSLPFLGKLENLHEYCMKVADKLGPVFSFYSGRRLAVVLHGREVITEALVKKFADFSDRPPAYIEIHEANVNLFGIMFKPYNESFKKYRKLSVTILKELGLGVKDEILILEEVELFLDETRRENGEPFEMKMMLSKATSNTVVAILFGRKFLQTGKEHTDLVKNIEKYAANFDTTMDVARYLKYLPHYRKKLANVTEAHVELKRCIAEGIKSARSEEDEDNNFVTKFIKLEGPDYDLDELVYILRDICHGAMDTTAGTIRWILLYLANKRELQDRAQKEIDSVVAKDRLPSLDDKQNLPYTEAFVLETMRYKSFDPFSIQHAASNDSNLNGYFIPKGALIITSLYSVHMDPKEWKDPENFRPERFLDEEERKVIGREKIISFSLGKRSCPGEALARKTLFLFVAALLQNFHIRPPEGQDTIVVSEVYSINVQPSAYKVRLIPR